MEQMCQKCHALQMFRQLAFITLYSVYNRGTVLCVRPMSEDCVHKWGTFNLHAVWLQNRPAQCVEDSQSTTRGMYIASSTFKSDAWCGFSLL